MLQGKKSTNGAHHIVESKAVQTPVTHQAVQTPVTHQAVQGNSTHQAVQGNSTHQGDHTHGTDSPVTHNSADQGGNTFTYTYSQSFGTPDRQGTQDHIDKQVLKGLSQSSKESLLNFKSLLKKLRQETYRRMNLDKPQKDNLATNLERTLYSNHATSYRRTPYTIARRDHTEGTQESLLLESTPYSDTRTKQEHTHYTLHIHQQVYKQDCTRIPICTDCTNNGAYSGCESRHLIKHTQVSTLPFSHYWRYALGTHKPQ